MRMRRNAVLWSVWAGLTLAAGGAVASVMYLGGSRAPLLIGDTTGAHHQIELACGACHTSGLFADAATVAKSMNKACLGCHQDELKVSNDSHPVKKFRDPRNADRREVLDALYCTTCHAEHVAEVTAPVAVTLPTDFCSACHKSIGSERESHRGLGFATCASAGCHNFHDNTALYEDFLARHAGMPWLTTEPVSPFAAASRAEPAVLAALRSETPLATLSAYLAEGPQPAGKPAEAAASALAAVLRAADAVAPTVYRTAEAVAAWDGSAHALAGVNCAGCHAPGQTGSRDPAALAAAWVPAPGLAVCADCHRPQAASFREGLHGMRQHPGLPAPRQPAADGAGPLLAAWASMFSDQPLQPMQVGEARIAMKAEAAAREIGSCSTCHLPHSVDLKAAAVEACASCHDDRHSRAYFDSPHYRLWQAEQAGLAAPGSGVSCADCHMPKLAARGGGFASMHNQNAYLRPNEKMIRPVCLSCHGLDFAIDALADPRLVEGNFNGRPSRHVESVDWAARRARKTE